LVEYVPHIGKREMQTKFYFEKNSLLGISRHRWKENIITYLKEIVY